jgi:hypothetical protein
LGEPWNVRRRVGAKARGRAGVEARQIPEGQGRGQQKQGRRTDRLHMNPPRFNL